MIIIIIIFIEGEDKFSRLEMNSNFVLLIKRLHDETKLVLYSYCFII